MEPTDFEKLITDLEIAVDRLRSLYDQYFMGIEKIEPAVTRKEVDRRIYALRKEQIRNTALRFRFQMVLQRYNTFQTYWQRICREIENGTYKRHLYRAERRFGKSASTRPSRPPSAAPAEMQAATPSVPPIAKPRPPPADLAAELAELDKEFAPPPPRVSPPVAAHTRTIIEATKTPGPSVSVPPPLPLAQSPQAQSRRGEPPRPPPPLSPSHTSPPRPPAVGGSAQEAAVRRQAAPRPAPPSVPRPAPPPLAPPAAPRSAAPPAPPSVPRPAPPPVRRSEGLTDDRVRQIYVEYVETKRRQNESTAAITYDAVAQSLRDSSARLSQKHGKPVDFEVAVRDGKAVLKPVLK